MLAAKTGRMTSLKYLIYQMDVEPANPEKNRQKVKQWLEEQVPKHQPDIIVLPEMWNTGYALERLEDLADDNGKETLELLKPLAKKYGVHIIAGSIANKRKDGIYNSGMVIRKDGELIHEYDKMHLVPMLNEPNFLQGGQSKGAIFELDGVKMGVVICYDLRFPELMRSIALQGAEVIHVVAQWPESRRTHWRYLQHARAIENECYVISANSAGICNDTQFAGESLVIEPNGDIVAEGSANQEETIQVIIDLEKVKEMRKSIPVFADRVPGLYRLDE